MNPFDLSILAFLNGFVNSCPHVDVIIVHMQHNNLAKGGVLMAVWWYCWFRAAAGDLPAGLREKQRILDRGRLIAGLLAVIAGIVVARLLAHFLPFRVRPFANPQLHFALPDSADGLGNLAAWSAFPSDHAVAWFAIAATLYLVDRRAGLPVLVYAALLGLGRVYAGYHHPTDILGGAAIGFLSVWVFNSRPAGRFIIFPILQWQQTRPGWFYAALFLCTYEMSNMFDELRTLAQLGWNALKLLV